MNTRFVIDNNGERYSYSKKRYGKLINLVLHQTQVYKRKIYNPFIIKGETTILYYWCQKEQKIYEILIDTEDYDKVKKYYWTIRKGDYTNYVYTRPNNKTIHLHRFIMNTPDHLEVDHINRNGLDNRKKNLRNVPPFINQRNKTKQSNNTSGVTGVDFTKDGKWRVRWVVKKGEVKSALFDTFEEAVKYRKQKEKENGYL